MTPSFTYQIGATPAEQLDIIALQRVNLRQVITESEALEQGFVTVSHTEAMLAQLCDALPPAVCKAEGRVVGYALAMPQSLKAVVPILAHMFHEFETVTYNGRLLAEYNYFVMGQVCVDKSCRGMGVFDGLYATLANYYRTQFDLLVTELSVRNGRSHAAHQRVGFQVLRTYTTPSGDWHIIALPLSDKVVNR